MSQPQTLHLVYLLDRVVLTRKPYTHWTEIQADFEDYKTSLGPWTPEEVIEYLQTEYPDSPPFSAAQIQSFLGSTSLTLQPSARP